MDTYNAIILISSLLIVSYIFKIISKKTSIPAVLMLMVFGVACQPFLPEGINNLKSILGIFGNIGLVLIVLEASLDLRLSRKALPDILKATASAIICLVSTSSAIASIIFLFNICTWENAFLYAVPFSVMSSAIVIPSVEALSGRVKEFLIYESSISDIVGIILFYFMLDLNKNPNILEVAGNTTFNLFITVICAFVLSYILIWIFTKIEDNTKLFLIISALTLLFALGKLFHLSSLIIIMIFGLILANPNIFFRGAIKKFFNKERSSEIGLALRNITLESAFVIKTFFFFLFGLSLNLLNLLDIKGIFMGLLILTSTYVIRFMTIFILRTKNTSLLSAITPRGLISILLFFSIPPSLLIGGMGEASMLLTIIISNVVMTFALMANSNKEEPKEFHENELALKIEDESPKEINQTENTSLNEEPSETPTV